MTQRVPMQSICVERDGKRVWPEIGQPFEFTAEEVQQGERMDPDMFSTLATVDVQKSDVTKKDSKPAKSAKDTKSEKDDI